MLAARLAFLPDIALATRAIGLTIMARRITAIAVPTSITIDGIAATRIANARIADTRIANIAALAGPVAVALRAFAATITPATISAGPIIAGPITAATLTGTAITGTAIIIWAIVIWAIVIWAIIIGAIIGATIVIAAIVIAAIITPIIGILIDAVVAHHLAIAVEIIIVAIVELIILAPARLIFFKARARFGKHPEIMIRKLQIIFGVHAITLHLGIARQRLVFLVQLRRIASRAIIYAIAVFGAAGIATLRALPAAAATAAGLTIIDQSVVVLVP